MFKASLFDLDGTLLLTEWQYDIFWTDIARRYRPDLSNFPMLIKGTPTADTIRNYFPAEVQPEVTRLLDDFEAHMDYTFLPGAIDFLKALKAQGILTAVVTSSNQQKVGYVRETVPDFDTLFDRILTTEDFSAPKPSPACYLRGAEVFGLTPADCVVFEDAPAGLQSGMASGSFTVGLATSLTLDELRSRCHYGIPDFTALTVPQLQALHDAFLHNC